jgi:hypothetical protein
MRHSSLESGALLVIAVRDLAAAERVAAAEKTTGEVLAPGGGVNQYTDAERYSQIANSTQGERAKQHASIEAPSPAPLPPR